MTVRDVLAVVTSLTTDRHVLDFAEDLSDRGDAFVTALAVGWMPPAPVAVEGWIVDGRWGELVEDARRDLEAVRVSLTNSYKRDTRRAARALLIEPSRSQSLLSVEARHADVTILALPESGRASGGRMTLVEAALFGSGRPVIVVPAAWRRSQKPDRVLVCWNSSRESARALADAMPFIEAAEQVVVVTIDAKPGLTGHGQAPGADIATHLARHGVKVLLRNADSLGRAQVDVVAEEARAIGAGLIVMGGYGRSRISEMIFGGLTRAMLEQAAVPVLMSH